MPALALSLCYGLLDACYAHCQWLRQQLAKPLTMPLLVRCSKPPILVIGGLPNGECLGLTGVNNVL
jgi:hypothetical protein